MITEIDYSKTSIPEVVNDILLYAVTNNAEYIFLDSIKDGIDVRLLINDDFIDYTRIPVEYKDNVIRRIKIISLMDILKTKESQKGRLKIEVKGLPMDFEIFTVPGNSGEDILIKVLSFKE
jgi:type II secretory ATPase GspE/PulE/Tfp pilus assembly ATPase PilB-like protein